MLETTPVDLISRVESGILGLGSKEVRRGQLCGELMAKNYFILFEYSFQTIWN